MKKLVASLLTVVLCALMPLTISAQEMDEVPFAETSDYIQPQSEDLVVYSEAWFAKMRTGYVFYENHYKTNMELEEGMGYIYGQKKMPPIQYRNQKNGRGWL